MKKNLQKIAALTFGLILLDQATKYLALVAYQEPLSLIDGLFSLTYSENTGVAFSIPIPQIVIIIGNVLLLILIAYLAIKELNLKKIISRTLIAVLLAGGISNLIDRVTRSFVIDFISIWKYPIFNIADIYITVAVAGILIFYNRIKCSQKGRSS